MSRPRDITALNKAESTRGLKDTKRLIPKPGPCPFQWCASAATRIENDDGWTRVACSSCGATGPVFGDECTEYLDRARKAAAAWNSAKKRRP